MAHSKRVAAHVLRFYQNKPCSNIQSSTRSLVTTPKFRHTRTAFVSVREKATRRTYSTTTKRKITGQEAPSAQAYIKSGVLSGKKDLVDVKKVLVIGSGGLSIGQAGEFDYSGKPTSRVLPLKTLSAGRLQKFVVHSQHVPVVIFRRFSSTQGSERSKRRLGLGQSKYCNYTNGSQAGRRGLLPSGYSRVCCLRH